MLRRLDDTVGTVVSASSSAQSDDVSLRTLKSRSYRSSTASVVSGSGRQEYDRVELDESWRVGHSIYRWPRTTRFLLDFR